MVALLFALIAAQQSPAQMAQNPSPMEEHRRAHPRLTRASPQGRRETLSLGQLFLPAKLKLRDGFPVLFFFHGGDWVPELAAAKRTMAVVTVQIGTGSGVYVRAFQQPDRWRQLLIEVEQRASAKAGRVTLAGWSAGCGAIRTILLDRESYDRIHAVLAIDGIHTGYQNSRLEPEHLQVYLRLANDAIARRKRFLITHSEIFPGTFASTTETADWLVHALGKKAKPVLRWGPMGTQQLSELKLGKFDLRGYAGNTAPDHVDQLHSLPDYLKKLK